MENKDTNNTNNNPTDNNNPDKKVGSIFDLPNVGDNNVVKPNEPKVEEKPVEQPKEEKKEEPKASEAAPEEKKENKPKAKMSKAHKLALGLGISGGVLVGAGIATGICIAVYNAKLNSSIFTITFEPGEGWIKEGKYQLRVDKSVSFSEISKPEVFNTDASKVFAGWFTDTTETLPFLDTNTITSNLTLTARFVSRDDANYSIVKFEKGTLFSGVSINGNAEFAIPKADNLNYYGFVNAPLASIANYKFKHWSTNPTEPWSDAIGNDTHITQATTLYPYFQYDLEKVIIQGPTNVYVSKQATYTREIVGSWSPIVWSVTNTDGTETDKATIDSSTGVLTGLKEGAVKVVATPTLAESRAASFDVTINNPYISSDTITTYGNVDGQDAWWIINNDSLYGSGEIKLTKFSDSTEKTIARNQFNLPVYIGQNVAGIKNGFLNQCTNFNSQIIFPDNCKIASLGSYFLYGCSSFNQQLTLPNTLLTIGSDFLSDCIAFNNGSDGTTTKDFTLPSEITTIQENFMNGASKFNQQIIMGDKVIFIRANFLYGCANFDSNIQFSEALTSIGSNFLDSCSLFNKPIELPDSLEEINSSFMNGCFTFNQDLTIPESIQRIGKDFMYDCTKMHKTITISTIKEPAQIFWESDKSKTLAVHNSSSEAYSLGITITGDQADKFKTLFPNNYSEPYRNLL